MKMSFGKNASRIYLNKSGDCPKKEQPPDQL